MIHHHDNSKDCKSYISIPSTNTVIKQSSKFHSTKNKSNEILTDQLMAIRLQKHNEFITSSSKRQINNKDANRKINKNNIITSTEISQDNGNCNNKLHKHQTLQHTAILGDSMINGINANGFKKDYKVKIKPYGDATSVDMIDHIKPTLRKKPSKIILHVGTNDITNNVDTVSNLRNILELVRKDSPQSTIAISNVIIRADKKDMSEKVRSLNLKIEELCHKENISIIKNSNINNNHLSKRKLHLNQKGLSMLAKNFIEYLN